MWETSDSHDPKAKFRVGDVESSKTMVDEGHTLVSSTSPRSLYLHKSGEAELSMVSNLMYLTWWMKTIYVDECWWWWLRRGNIGGRGISDSALVELDMLIAVVAANLTIIP